MGQQCQTCKTKENTQYQQVVNVLPKTIPIAHPAEQEPRTIYEQSPMILNATQNSQSSINRQAITQSIGHLRNTQYTGELVFYPQSGISEPPGIPNQNQLQPQQNSIDINPVVNSNKKAFVSVASTANETSKVVTQSMINECLCVLINFGQIFQEIEQSNEADLEVKASKRDYILNYYVLSDFLVYCALKSCFLRQIEEVYRRYLPLLLNIQIISINIIDILAIFCNK